MTEWLIISAYGWVNGWMNESLINESGCLNSIFNVNERGQFINIVCEGACLFIMKLYY